MSNLNIFSGLNFLKNFIYTLTFFIIVFLKVTILSHSSMTRRCSNEIKILI